MSNKKLLGTSLKGKLFVVSAPAGTGKTTLVRMLQEEFPTVIASISYTSRKPRMGEEDGVHYHFITRQEFEEKIENQEFLEYIELYGDYYGTSKIIVQKELDAGKHVILVIDTQGGLFIREKMKSILIFIEPPSLGALNQRLILRGTESKEAIEKRLSFASAEMERGKKYDYRVINETLPIAYEILRSILIAEDHRI